MELYKSKSCKTRSITPQAMATTESPAVIKTQPLPLEVALGSGLVLPGKNWQPIPCPDPVQKESPSLARLLGDVKSVLVNQRVEKVEAATRFFSFNCCKVETENSYQLKDASSGATLLEAVEDSAWCLRNPCLCCDCVCWCCHSECGSRRAFTLTLAEQEGAAMQLEMTRPCRSDCLPCCLQSITVTDSDHQQLGLVRQVLGYSPPFEICGKFEVCDAEGEVVYVIRTPASSPPAGATTPSSSSPTPRAGRWPRSPRAPPMLPRSSSLTGTGLNMLQSNADALNNALVR